MSALVRLRVSRHCRGTKSTLGGHSVYGEQLATAALPSVESYEQDSFYKTLDEEGSKRAFNNEYDFDSPNAIDFDVLVDRLRDLKAGYILPVPSGSISANGF